MHKKLFSALYVMNIVLQAFFDLVLPMALLWGLSYLLTTYASAPGWIYAPLIIIGALAGLVSMVKFILSAMAALERLENQNCQKESKNDERSNNGQT